MSKSFFETKKKMERPTFSHTHTHIKQIKKENHFDFFYKINFILKNYTT